ncbi:hypothetical protein V9T40_006359 [Parthenolecanium corni]|uniref:Uncharacterized protein n=1 Tax=Parthenolecanium corni TaxID=536013 RepID=A0AAN9TM46_9HEMI
MGAFHQAFVFSIPVDSEPTNLSKSMDIIGKAAVDIIKSAGEFWQDIKATVENRVNLEQSKYVELLLYRVEIMLIASGDTSQFKMPNGKIGPEDLKQFQVVAKSVAEVAGRLDTMESANELIIRTVREVYDSRKLNRPTQIIHKLLDEENIRSLFDTLDKNFQGEKGLQDIYKKLREKNKNLVFPPKEADFPVDSWKSKIKNFKPYFLNYFFVQFIHYRLTVPRENFILARSIVELAKDAKKFEQVQSIYEQAMQEVSIEELFKSSPKFFEIMKFQDSVFLTLKENFEKHPSINAELQTVKKDVSQRREWDRSIWDLPL